MTFATSRNLTILGICTVLGALAGAAALIFDGDPLTNPDWAAVITALVSGVGMIMAKGAKSTGGTVDGSGNPVGPTLVK